MDIAALRIHRPGFAAGSPASARLFPVLLLVVCSILNLCIFGAFPQTAEADEADDLQRMISSARRNASDLERLDTEGASREELTILRIWLDDAWRLRGASDYDDTRVVLERCDQQAEMIRQVILAGQLKSRAKTQREALARKKEQIQAARDALQKAKLAKAALEARLQ